VVELSTQPGTGALPGHGVGVARPRDESMSNPVDPDDGRFVDAGGLRWHLQIQGAGPIALLVHGTGASNHSWRGLIPYLAPHFTVLAPDLPGHGRTSLGRGRNMSLPGMSDALGELLLTMDADPVLAVGHSAGVAVLARLALDGGLPRARLASVNGALLPLRGVQGHLFSPMAKLLAINPLVPRLVSWAAGQSSLVDRMLADTGSRIDPTGVEQYRRLAGSPRHVAAALKMMARWDLQPLGRELGRITSPLLLIAGAADRMVPPEDAQRVRALIPEAELVAVDGLGHLAHEESPGQIADLLLGFAHTRQQMIRPSEGDL